MSIVISIIKEALDLALDENCIVTDVQADLATIKNKLEARPDYYTGVEAVRLLQDDLNQIFEKVYNKELYKVTYDLLRQIFDKVLLKAKLLALEPTVNKLPADEQRMAVNSKLKAANEYFVQENFIKTNQKINIILNELATIANKEIKLKKEVLYLRFVYLQEKAYLSYLYVNALPKDILRNGFRFLESKDLKSTALVCKDWCSLLKPTIRVAMLSYDCTGQTALIECLATKQFPTRDMPISDEFVNETKATLNDKIFIFYDISRHKIFSECEFYSDKFNIALQKIPRMDVFVVLLGNNNFIYGIESYKNYIKNEINQYFNNEIPVLFIGTKVDSLATNTYRTNFADNIAELEKEFGKGVYRECSAKTGQGINEIIPTIINKVHKPSLENDYPAEGFNHKRAIM